MGMEEAQKLSLSIKDAFDYPRRCPACPLLNKKAWRRRGHLLKHLTNKVHEHVENVARLLLLDVGHDDHHDGVDHDDHSDDLWLVGTVWTRVAKDVAAICARQQHQLS